VQVSTEDSRLFLAVTFYLVLKYIWNNISF
jgi:hypothetical protein